MDFIIVHYFIITFICEKCVDIRIDTHTQLTAIVFIIKYINKYYLFMLIHMLVAAPTALSEYLGCFSLL